MEKVYPFKFIDVGSLEVDAYKGAVLNSPDVQVVREGFNVLAVEQFLKIYRGNQHFLVPASFQVRVTIAGS